MRLYTRVNYEIICKAAAARLIFLPTLATQHYFVKLQGLRSQDVARVTRGTFCNKIVDTTPPSASVAEQALRMSSCPRADKSL